MHMDMCIHVCLRRSTELEQRQSRGAREGQEREERGGPDTS